MDFKSLISKLDGMEAPPETPRAPKLPEKIQLDEDAQLRVLAGTSTILAEAEIMEKKLTKAEKEKKEEVVKSMKKDKVGFKERYGKRGEEVMHATATKIAKKKAESVESDNAVISELDMNLIKAAQKGQEGKPVGKPDAESDKNVRKKYGYRMDGEPAERDDDETKQDRRGRKRKNTGESIVEADEEGPEDLLAAAEEEYNQPGRHIDNLQDVMNATFGADQSPEFERAREIINRYLEFVTNTDVDHYDDEEDPDHEDEPMIRAMRHGNIQKHIREYDLGDYLAAALGELDKVVRKGESFNRRAFESKFAKMVEAKKQESKKTVKGKKAEEKMDEAKKPDEDGDGVPDWADKKPGEDDNADKKKSGKKGMTAKQAKYFGKKAESVEEGNDPLQRGYNIINKKPRKGQTDFRNIPAGNHPDSKNKYTDDDRDNYRAGLKRDIKKSLGQHKKPNLPENTETGSIAKKKGKTESVRRSKKVVAESFEPKMSFRDMMKLVVESGGQQQIDPLDKALFAWATRVAQQKFNESTKAEVYAGLVYERMGGRFEMYDVLKESKVVRKKSRVNEGKTYNLPLNVSGLAVMKKLPEDAIPRFIEMKLGLPENSMYFDDTDLVLHDKTIAQSRESVGDMLEKTKRYIERNPNWMDDDM